uniref:CCHC-type domain-containing protein n=1 Tax=Strongyloides stercoralis TaxID=6248 RepID=A0A0K0ENQ8_STRER
MDITDKKNKLRICIESLTLFAKEDISVVLQDSKFCDSILNILNIVSDYKRTKTLERVVFKYLKDFNSTSEDFKTRIGYYEEILFGKLETVVTDKNKDCNMADLLSKIEPYVNKRENISLWLERFKIALKLKKVPDEDKLDYLVIAIGMELGGVILKWKENNNDITFDQVCEKLVKEYKLDMEKVTLRRKILSFKLDPHDEKFDSKIYEFVDLIKQCEDDMDQEKLYWEVRVKLSEILNKYDGLYDLIMEGNHIGITDLVEKVILKAKRIVDKSKIKSRKDKYNVHFVNDKKEIKCFNCGKLGHIKKDCRVKVNNVHFKREMSYDHKEEKKPDVRTVRIKEVKNSNDNWTPMDLTKDLVMKTSLHGKKDIILEKGPTILMPVTLKNFDKEIKIHGFIDTGSNISMLSLNIAKMLKLKIDNIENIDLTLATGIQTKVNKAALVYIKFPDGRFIKKKLLISNEKDKKYALVIGSDILETIKAKIEFDKIGNYKMFDSNNTIKKVVAENVNVENRDLREKIIKEFPEVYSNEKIGKCIFKIPPFEYKDEKIPNNDIIVPSKWPKTILNIHCVPKKDTDKVRVVLDARPVNEIYKEYQYPLPRTDKILNDMKGGKYFSVIDLNSYFLQLQINEKDQEYLAFRDTYGRNYQFQRLPFGIKNACSYAQNISEKIAEGTVAKLYIDDFILVTKNDWQEHVQEVIRFSQKLKDLGVTANISKSRFGCEAISALGYIITRDGIMPEVKILDAWLNYPNFTSYKGIRRFVGAVNWFRGNIPELAKALKPLCAVMSKKGPYENSKEINDAFNEVKETIKKACIAYHPDPNKEFTLVTDASNFYVAGALLQQNEKGYIPIGFYSKSIAMRKKFENIEEKFNDENGYIPAGELELKAICECLDHFKYIIGNTKTWILTDHKPLIGMVKNSTNKFMLRYISHLSNFNIELKYIPGIHNQLADAISRASLKCCHVNGKQVENDRFLEYLNIDTEINDSKEDESFFEEEGSDSCSDNYMLFDIDDNLQIKEITNVKKRRGRPPKVKPDETVNDKELIDKLTPKMSKLDKLDEQNFLMEIHESNGHIGYTKMLHLIGNHDEGLDYKIENLTGKIVKILSSCIVCQGKHKAHLRKVNETPIIYSGPGQALAIDVLGPIDVSEQNNKYILLTVDCYSKYVTLSPIASQEFENIALSLLQNVFMKHGYYPIIHADNASNFKSSMLKEWLSKMNIVMNHSSEYYHKGNALAERYIQTAQHILYKMAKGKPRDWDKFLASVEFVMNSNTGEFNGYSPYFLMTGREPNLAITMLTHQINYDLRESAPSMASFISSMEEIIHDVHERRVDEALCKEITKGGYVKIEKGDYVLIYQPIMPGISRKLQGIYGDEKYKVVNFSIDYVKVISEKSRKCKVVHRSLIKKVSKEI